VGAVNVVVMAKEGRVALAVVKAAGDIVCNLSMR
jgi:hypothetical protein